MSAGVTFAELVDLAEIGMAPTAAGPAPVMRPLSERHRARVFVLREGALDYRAIPSLCANERVPFKRCINTVDEVAQA